MEFPRKIVEFSWNSFLNLFPDDPFSRSFSVVFAVIPGENQRISEKNREKQRISEKSFRFLSFSFHFITLSFLIFKSARFYALQHVYCRYFVREVECLKYYCYFCT